MANHDERDGLHQVKPATPPDTNGLLQALTSARIYDLAQPLHSRTPSPPGIPKFQMALAVRHGDSVTRAGGSYATELLTLGTHTGTHVDALCHVSDQGSLYSGISAEEACRGGKFKSLGVEEILPLFCRGVLLDIPAVRRVESLSAGEAVTVNDIEAACRHQAIQILEGDAVLIRTGASSRYEREAAYTGSDGTGAPGPDESAGRWLGDRRIRITGADTLGYEWTPPGKDLEFPIHILFLAKLGIPILENLNLDELARARAYEFVFAMAPLLIPGASGAPVRPLAIVAHD